MFAPGTKFTGDHFDEELQLYLDVPADVQLYPMWWVDHPRAYARLVELRKEKGIEVDDQINIGIGDLEPMMSNAELLKAAEEDDD